ncbi:hypothetical protein EPN96_01520 [bacterium]|nr:MAG: hypothetical protein EPN96_01520 [bacterium]
MVLRALEISFSLFRHTFYPSLVSLANSSPLPFYEGIRNAFEKLGPAFVKLGQFFSIREDLVGPAFASVMEKLQDSAAPMEFSVVRSVVERELAAPLPELFASFEPLPLASASVSQVHRARLHTGEEVAVKVLRPEAKTLLLGDARLLAGMANLLHRTGLFKKHIDLPAFALEIQKSAEAEVDFRREAEVSERFARNFKTPLSPRIPRIFWSHTTEKILTAEYIPGKKISDPSLRREEGYPELAEQGAEFFLRQVLDHGLFHADLHPANLLVSESGEITYLDFGINGELSEEERHAIFGTLAGLLAEDAPLALRHLKKLGVRVDREREAAFAEDIRRAMESAMTGKLKDADLRVIGRGILGAVRRNRVAFPHKYALLIKALLTVEGSARTLHGDFDFAKAARRYLLTSFAGKRGAGLIIQATYRGAMLCALAGNGGVR